MIIGNSTQGCVLARVVLRAVLLVHESVTGSPDESFVFLHVEDIDVLSVSYPTLPGVLLGRLRILSHTPGQSS